jgi:hypothetical protein
VAVVFFTLLFGVFELARIMYMWSTLAEVVGRAARMAAMENPRNEAQVRSDAMFRNAAGRLPLGGGIDPSYLRIDYLAANRQTRVTPPACPEQNIINCTNDPLGASCIRFVRVRLCKPGTDCTPVSFVPAVGLDALANLNIELPTFATVAPVEALGMPAACTP